MIPFRFKHVCIESYGLNLPPIEVTSAEIEDRLAPLYQRLEIPFGTLEKISGIKTRYFWPTGVLPSQVGTEAARTALDGVGFDRSHIQTLFNCSVTRDYFEPATACVIHEKLGMPEVTMALDISNACVGFSNGLLFLANMIESGVVKAGVVVSSENLTRVIEHSMSAIANDQVMNREQLLKLLPMFTLGSGAVAYVLAHDSIATKKHRIVGSAARSATQHVNLCNGNGDFHFTQTTGFDPIMYTESSKLIGAAAELGSRTWKDASEVLGWKREDIQHIFCHQVGRQVNDAFYKEMGLDYEKEFSIYRKFGNLVSAALPTCLAMGIEEKGVKSGEKILLTGFGSGLNSIFTGIEW